MSISAIASSSTGRSPATPPRALDEEGASACLFYFYHSPIFAPSFDADGQATYLAWLRNRYTVEEINERYGASFASIDAMAPADYWTNPDHAAEEKPPRSRRCRLRVAHGRGAEVRR